MEGSRPDADATMHPVEICLDNLRDQVFNVLQNEASYQEQIQKLETELSVYKRAFVDVDADLKKSQIAQMETEAINRRLEKECQIFKKQDQGHRIITLIDGDGAIFSSQLIAQGQKGGHAAAQLLSDGTYQHIAANHDLRALQLWVYVFFNKRGLIETFRRTGLAVLISKVDDFVIGFNQATERFLMVDVGSTKEAADAKLKVYLEDEIRLPQTYKVIFGGCHDNGYVTSLHSQITAGFKEKLILLKSYTEMAGGIAALALPSLTIPDLFIPHKLDDLPSSPTGTKLPKEFNPPLSGNVNLSFTPPPTSRTVNPSIKPMLCTLYYLKNCRFGAGCRFAHDYAITESQRDDLLKIIKKTPCPAALNGTQCKFGDGCCYAHVCPHAPNCSFLKQGKCKFRQASMHPVPVSG
ncbi:hypothetical protein R3P38DRAFT_2925133 [Favolaschia claudopus]|uniref:C3H1-type domain-containing protein n=1 Tax=Favolaschia claudopus TaxID=2862362 RepID=A0AAW0BXZ2_9AGAR